MKSCAPYLCDTRACAAECRRNDDCTGATRCIERKCQQLDAPDVRFTVATPVIDGIEDEVWKAVPSFPIKNLAAGAVGGPEDLTAGFKALWTAEAFYLIVDIADNSLRNDSPAEWQDDALQIFFDADYSRGQTYDGTDDLQYIFGWNDPAFKEAKLNRVQGVTVFSRNKQGNLGYVFEARFPWATLGAMSPSPGKRIGFQLEVDDDDQGQGTEREALVVWFGKSGEAYLRPASFGELVLTGN